MLTHNASLLQCSPRFHCYWQAPILDHQNHPYSLVAAKLDWQDGVPSAKDYGDVYFSRDDGLAESRYVFLQHNRLEERWRQLDGNIQGRFTICETGFGTGLNFLLACELWLRTAPPSWTLHYISCEKHPLTPGDLHRALSAWPSLRELSTILQDNYPPLIPGQHRRYLHKSQICLDLLFGDILDTLPQLLDSVCTDSPEGAVDAWFLDGFAPSTNPEMWQPALFDTMARLSHRGSSFATFTSAGLVKRGLREVGFVVHKVKGYGRKRDMLSGEFEHYRDACSTESASQRLPLSPLPWHQPGNDRPPQTALVIGGGLAGCSTARVLAERGIAVTLIERHPALASEASGNPQGVLYTKLSPEPGVLNWFTLNSFLFALAHYRPILHKAPDCGDLCGVLQLPGSEREAALMARLQDGLCDQHWLEFVTAERARVLSGLDIDRSGIFYPQAGWLSPPGICAAYVAHPSIQRVHYREVATLHDDGEQWQALDADGQPIASAQAVVVAGSHEASQLSQCSWLPLRRIRGQLSYFRSDDITVSPQCVVCHDGYFAPPRDGVFCLGASFDLHNTGTDLSAADHQFNIDTLAKLSPTLLKDGAGAIGGRAALRCASPDYMPIVGAAPDAAAFDKDYAGLRKDAKQSIPVPGRYHRQLYINVAHGSRGLTSTPLSAELIAAYLCRESRPLPRQLTEQLSPARFLIRDLMRNRR